MTSHAGNLTVAAILAAALLACMLSCPLMPGPPETGPDEAAQEAESQGPTAEAATARPLDEATPPPATAAGATEGEEGADCLSDLPVYPGSQEESQMTEDMKALVRSVETMSGTSSGNVSVHSTADAPGDVVQFYHDNPPAGGWEKSVDLTSKDDGGFITWSKGDVTASVLIGVEGGRTLIVLGCGPKLGSDAAPGVPTYSEENGLPDNSVMAIAIDEGGSVWVGTSGGVSHFDGAEWTTYSEAEGLPSAYYGALALGPDGTLWAGSRLRGLAHFDGSAWEMSREPVMKISALATGPDGTLWLASCDVSDGGVYHHDGQAWTRYEEESGLHHCVNDVTVAPSGTVWAATSGGLATFDGTAWTVHTTADGLAHDEVHAVAVDRAGAVWAGTEAGASRFDRGNWATYTADDTLVAPKIAAVEVAPDGSVWFATGGGVSRLRGGQWEAYTEAEGLPSNRVVAIAAAPDGRIWLGTPFDGVAVLDPAE